MGALIVGAAGIVAAGVALVASMRPAAAVAPRETTPPPQTPPPEAPTSQQSKPKQQTRPVDLDAVAKFFEALGPEGGAAAAGIGGVTAAGVAGTAALVAATGALGYAITGDAAGGGGAVALLAYQAASGTGTGVVQAQAGNIGRVAGREIDALFNGPIGNAGTSALYQAAGFFTGAFLSIGGLAALPAVGQLALLVVGIGNAISEQNRLAYGQAGATRDAIAEARGFYDSTLANLRAVANATFGVGQVNDDRLKTIAANMAIGWAHEVQDGRGRVLSSAPGPIFVAPGPARNQWAWDRGLLVRDMAPVVNALAALSGHIADVDGFTAQTRGRELANIGHFLKLRKEARGLGLTQRQHLEYWRARGAFRCDELYAEGNAVTAPNDSNDSIRISGLWYLGAESDKAGALKTSTW